LEVVEERKVEGRRRLIYVDGRLAYAQADAVRERRSGEGEVR
jgi:hypothetical protein